MFFSIDRQQFLEQFDQLWLLSRESFEQGLLDKEAEKWGKKSKKRPVGEQLLNDLTTWRTALSKDILARNKDKRLTEEELDEAVQRFIDRLIFIRNCEDRELEPPTLLRTMREWDSKRKGALVEHIREVFRHFWDEYDSELFKGQLCDQLNASNQVLEEIINGLDHTEDRAIKYDFSAIDADVLGNVYEQYLGHVLKKTKKRAAVIEKHAHRKEQGIYYTPTYIVNYIVRNTLGELLKDKTVDVEKIRVLDSACGSGSFLIKAFDVLNEYHSKKDKDYNQTRLDVEAGTTFTKKVEILKNNIFGVDLDTQAVEIARLNLLLKIAEKGHRLPLLKQNIKCGNSLIDDSVVAGDKAFKWEDKFKHIMDEGGFDVVIGNPPYVGWAKGKQSRADKDFYEDKYNEIYSGKNDLYYYFMYKSINLLKEGGLFSFIVSRYFLESIWAQKLRGYIIKNCTLKRIVDFRETRVFQDANVHTCIFVIEKKKPIKNSKVEIIFDNLNNEPHIVSIEDLSEMSVWYLEEKSIKKIISKIEQKSKPITEFLDIKDTVLSALDKVYVLTEEDVRNNNLEFTYLRKFLTSKDIKNKYSHVWGRKYIIHIDKETDFNKSSKLKKYLELNKALIYKRNKKRKEDLGLGLARPMLKYDWNSDKLFCPSRCTNNRFILDTEHMTGSRHNVTVLFNISKKNPKYFLGLLNSRLYEFYFKSITKKMGKSYEYLPKYLIKLRVIVDVDEDKIIQLVDKMLTLNKRLNEIGDKKTDARQRIEEEIKRTDAEIDELVYKLYGITDAEKKIIKESLG